MAVDASAFERLRIAPRVVFDRLATHAERPRFMLPPAGDPAAPPEAWRPVTWGAFAAMTRDVALFLVARGLAHGDRVAILADNGVPWLAAALGVQAAGGVMVPIYPSSTADQVAYVLDHSDARVVFVGGGRLARALSDALARHRIAALVEVVTLGGELAAGPATRTPWEDALAIGARAHAADPTALARRLDSVSLEAPALMLYTSGTSGSPKGVPLTHMNVGVNGRDWIRCNAPALDEGARDLLWLPMSHIFGFGEACLGNLLGWTSYLSDPASVLEHLPRLAPEVFMSVPSLWDKLATRAAEGAGTPEAAGARLRALTGGRLRFCLSGGAGLKREVKDLFHHHGTLVLEGYGLTEASPTLTLNRPDAFRFDSVGLPLPSVALRLADDGEILARGPSIFGGYHKDPASTAAAFTEDGWLKTGDVGRFTEDGFLQIVDRKKDILVTAGGKNVPPANIELRFADDPWIAHVVVYGDGKRYLVAGVWPTPEARAALAPEALRARVAERVAAVNATLPSYETIKRFFIADAPLTLESGLLTPTLKVKRKQVNAAFHEHFEALYDDAPRASGAPPGSRPGGPGGDVEGGP
ncbi:MAG: AMP-binding protein [Deltaproteobacteria bacterium]|nr:AMP-binding protein [Deltaproteobacteria bacterium]